MKKLMELAVTICLLLPAQFASAPAAVPAARHLTAFLATLADAVVNEKGGAFAEGFSPGPSAKVKRMVAKRQQGTSSTSTGTDPEVGAPPEDIIARWGYPWEKYDVITDDGYILALYRIPNSHQANSSLADTPRPVVFLQHGLECSCTNWIENLPDKAAAFMFADAGFDVWMGNFRGNTYSKRHTTLSPTSHEFWKFSWDEMAQYDLPAMINKTLNISGAQKLYYVGHSMGTLTAFALFSQNQQFAQKIIKFYALGPIYTVKDIKGVFRWLAPFTNSLDILFKLVGMDEFLPNSWLMDQLAKYFCGSPVSDAVCTNILFLFSGPDSHQTNVSRLPVYLSHTPAGTSTQNIVHFGQMVESGKCQMYDWGRRENKKRYHQNTPPEYDVSRMQTPVAVFWGGLDWLATPTDVERLIPKLQRLFDNRYLQEFNHLDFIWGLRAASDAYQPILTDIKADFENRIGS